MRITNDWVTDLHEWEADRQGAQAPLVWYGQRPLDGTAEPWASAPMFSEYFDRELGIAWKKYSEAGTTADWTMLAAYEVNVKGYGAIGDGVADDTVALQAALASGKSLYFPTGTYLIRYAEDVTPIFYKTSAAEITLHGDGVGQTIIQGDMSLLGSSDRANMFSCRNTHLHNMTLDGGFDPANHTAMASMCVFLYGYSSAHQLHVKNVQGSCIGGGSANTYQLSVRDNLLENFGDHAIYIGTAINLASPYEATTTCQNVTIEGNTILYNDAYQNNPSMLNMRGNICIREGVENYVVRGNHVTGGNCIEITWQADHASTVPKGLLIANNTLLSEYTAINVGATPSIAYNYLLQDLLISGNYMAYYTGGSANRGAPFFDKLQYGLRLTLAGAIVSNNVFANYTNEGATGIGLLQNGVAYTGTEQCVISNNRFYNCDYGVSNLGKSSAVDNNLFQDCVIGIRDTYRMVMRNNILAACTTGIQLIHNATSLGLAIVASNHFQGCSTPLELDSGLEAAAIIDNTFAENTGVIGGSGTDWNRLITVNNKRLSGAHLPAFSSAWVYFKESRAWRHAVTLPATPNLVDDASFELGTAVVVNVGTPTTSARLQGAAYTGIYGWILIADAIGEGIYRAFTTQAQATYIITARVYNISAGGVTMTVTSGATVTTAATATTGVGFEYLQVVHITPVGATSTQIKFTVTGSTGGFYTDDLTLAAKSSALAIITYNLGEIVWNDAPSAGAAAGWLCTRAGTLGTIEPTTGNTSAGGVTVSNVAQNGTLISSSTNLQAGQVIDITGDSNGPFLILNVNTTTHVITLNHAVSNTATGAAIFLYLALFEPFGGQTITGDLTVTGTLTAGDVVIA